MRLHEDRPGRLTGQEACPTLWDRRPRLSFLRSLLVFAFLANAYGAPPTYNHDIAPYAHDPAAAAQLLEHAGYRRSGDHWTKNGQPLELHLSAHKSLESSQEIVINLQSQLQSQGIAVDVEFLDDATWKAKIWRERDYDLILSQWSFDRNEDVREQFHSKGSRNFTGYASETTLRRFYGFATRPTRRRRSRRSDSSIRSSTTTHRWTSSGRSTATAR